MDCPFPKLFPSQLVKDDLFYMQLAYNQAIDAWREEEVPIGAVIVHNGEVIAQAHNQVEKNNDATAHAELLAITQACTKVGDWRLNEAILYVTKEPCPMCSGAMIMARLGRVVYAFSDPLMGGMGGAFNVNDVKTLNHHTAITVGVLEEECRSIIRSFFEIKRKKNKSSASED